MHVPTGQAGGDCEKVAGKAPGQRRQGGVEEQEVKNGF